MFCATAGGLFPPDVACGIAWGDISAETGRAWSPQLGKAPDEKGGGGTPPSTAGRSRKTVDRGCPRQRHNAPTKKGRRDALPPDRRNNYRKAGFKSLPTDEDFEDWAMDTLQEFLSVSQPAACAPIGLPLPPMDTTPNWLFSVFCF